MITTIILIALTIVSSLMTIGLIWCQINCVRKGQMGEACNPLLMDALRRKIDSFTIKVNLGFRTISRLFYFYFLVLSRKVFLFFHLSIARIDQRFSKMIHSVHNGRRQTPEAGKASFFLTEIKNFRDQTGPGRIDA